MKNSRKLENVEITFSSFNNEFRNCGYAIWQKIVDGDDYREERAQLRDIIRKLTNEYTYYPTDWIIKSEEVISKMLFNKFIKCLYGISILAINNKWLSEVSNIGSYKEPESESYKRRTLNSINKPIDTDDMFEYIAYAIYYEIQKNVSPYSGAGSILKKYISYKTGLYLYYPSDWCCHCKMAVQQNWFDAHDFEAALYGITQLSVMNGWVSELTDAE